MKISSHVLRDLKERFDDNNEKLAEFLTLATPREVFREYCEWHGIFGYSNDLFQVVLDLNTGSSDSIHFGD